MGVIILTFIISTLFILSNAFFIYLISKIPIFDLTVANFKSLFPFSLIMIPVLFSGVFLQHITKILFDIFHLKIRWVKAFTLPVYGILTYFCTHQIDEILSTVSISTNTELFITIVYVISLPNLVTALKNNEENKQNSC